jgi:hypothetical protein
MRMEDRVANFRLPVLCGLIILGGLACLVPVSPLNLAMAQPGAAAAPDSKIEWTQFEDPFEKAFVVEVPKGWTAKGGLFRLGYSDERPMVDLVSPDGAINIRLGDVSIPSYTVPVQFHEREGEVYDLGAQAQMIVERYRSGPEFAVLYAQARLAKICHDPQSDAQDSDFSVKDYLPMDSTMAAQASGGQTAFYCVTDHGRRVAYVYTKTALSGKIWQAPTVASFLAPAGQVAAVREIVAHAVQSFHVYPQWLDYQKRMDAEGLEYQRVRQQGRMMQLQAQMQQFAAKMQAMQNQVNAFERRQNAQAAQVEGFTNVLNGVTPTTDPLTGENRQVWTGPKANYWVNGLGQVVNSTNAPAAGWRQLQTN